MFQISKQTLSDVVKSLKNYIEDSFLNYTGCLNVLTDRDNNRVKFYVSNRESNVVYLYYTTIESDKDYSYSIPLRTISPILDVIQEGYFYFNTPVRTGESYYDVPVTFDHYKTKYLFRCQDLDDYVLDDVPNWTLTSQKDVIKLSTDLFMTYGGLLSTCASSDVTKSILNSINFHYKDDFLDIASTDGMRFTLYQEKLDNKIDSDYSFTVSLPFFNHLVTAIKNQSKYISEVEILYQKDKVLFKVGNLVYLTRIVDGTYPDYNKILSSIDDSRYSQYSFYKKELLSSLSAIQDFAKGNKFNPKVGCIFNDDVVNFNYYCNEIGSSMTQVKPIASPKNGKTIEIHLNVNYIVSILKGVPSEVINLFVHNTNDILPVKVTSQIPSLVNILMPIRI